MAEHGDNRRADRQTLLRRDLEQTLAQGFGLALFRLRLVVKRLLLRFGELLDLDAHLLGYDGCHVEVDALGDRGHDAIVHQHLDDVDRAALHELGHITYRDVVRQLDLIGWLGHGRFGPRRSTLGPTARRHAMRLVGTASLSLRLRTRRSGTGSRWARASRREWPAIG